MRFITQLLLFCFLTSTLTHGASLTYPISESKGGTGRTTYSFSPATADNYSLAVSVASNAMTVALKHGSTGNGDCSTTQKCRFSIPTTSSGAMQFLTVTGARSIVVPSTATLGTVNNQTHWFYVYVMYTGSPLGELAISNGGQFGEYGNYNTTALDTASDNAATLYSTTARTGADARLIGAFAMVQTTAGTWATGVATWKTWPLAPPVAPLVTVYNSSSGTHTFATNPAPRWVEFEMVGAGGGGAGSGTTTGTAAGNGGNTTFGSYTAGGGTGGVLSGDGGAGGTNTVSGSVQGWPGGYGGPGSSQQTSPVTRIAGGSGGASCFGGSGAGGAVGGTGAGFAGTTNSGGGGGGGYASTTSAMGAGSGGGSGGCVKGTLSGVTLPLSLTYAIGAAGSAGGAGSGGNAGGAGAAGKLIVREYF